MGKGKHWLWGRTSPRWVRESGESPPKGDFWVPVYLGHQKGKCFVESKHAYSLGSDGMRLRSAAALTSGSPTPHIVKAR